MWIGDGHFYREDAALRIRCRRNGAHSAGERLRESIGSDGKMLAQTHPADRSIRHAEDGLHRLRVGQGKAISGRPHQAAQIDIATDHPSIERGAQLAIGKRHIGLAELCLGSGNRGRGAGQLRLG